jgi:hypothetical protein
MGWKTAITLDEYERNILIRALNNLRTSLLKEKRSTDAVDELMVKIYDARLKNVRVAEDNRVEHYR